MKLYFSSKSKCEIETGVNTLALLPTYLKKYAVGVKIAIITDKTVETLYRQKIEEILKQTGHETYWYAIDGGEKSKTLSTIESIYDFLADNSFLRNDFILAFGGGVVGDIAGFAAATYMRGVSYGFVPTTLLAMADSCLGGKTGVNTNQGKNMAGCFYQPKFVLADTAFLATLQYEQITEGFAEAVKCAMIFDKNLFVQLCENNLQKEENISQIIKSCQKIKISHVKNDERDFGKRQLLNFGHTLGHAIEKLSEYKISHGNAVSVGMVMVCQLGEKIGITEPGTTEKLMRLLKKFGLPTDCPYAEKDIFIAALADKKRNSEKLSLVCIKKIGTATIYQAKLSDLPV